MSTILAATEITKLLLSGYFSYAKQQGLSDDEMTQAIAEAKKEFEGNTPDKLKDV